MSKEHFIGFLKYSTIYLLVYEGVFDIYPWLHRVYYFFFQFILFQMYSLVANNHILYIVFPSVFPVPQLTPYIVTAVLLTIFPMLYLHPSYYSVTTNLYFLIASPLSSSLPNPLPSDNYQFAICVYESASFLFVL